MFVSGLLCGCLLTLPPSHGSSLATGLAVAKHSCCDESDKGRPAHKDAEDCSHCKQISKQVEPGVTWTNTDFAPAALPAVLVVRPLGVERVFEDDSLFLTDATSPNLPSRLHCALTL